MTSYKLFVVSLAALLILFVGCTGAPGKYDDFSKCLTEKGVKMYGAFWCPHCQNTKDAFGSSFKYVTYIECSTPDGNSQTAQCKNAGIQGYPTWEFEGGHRESGELSIQAISAYSGCPVATPSTAAK